MENAATGFDESAEPRQTEERDGLHQPQHDDLSSKTAMEDDLLSAHQGYLDTKQAMEDSHVDDVHKAQHRHLSSEKIMQEGYSDGVHIVQHGESDNEKATEGGFDDGLHGAQQDYVNSKKETQEDYANDLDRAQQCDLRYKQTMEEGHSDENTETEKSHEYAASSNPSMLPQPSKATNAQSPSDSCVKANLADFGSLSEHHNQCTNFHNELDPQADVAASGIMGKRHPEKITLAQEAGDHADQNIDTHGRPSELSHAAYMASFGTLGKHMHENGVDDDSLQGDAYKNASAFSISGQHPGGNVFANSDFYTQGAQLGRYPHKTVFADGNVGENAQGSAYEDSFQNGDFRGNVYDDTNTKNEADPNAHEKVTASNETRAEDFKIDLSQNVRSMQAPSFMNSPIKNGSVLSGSSYYKTKSGFMKKSTGVVFRLGCAIFSLVAFSVIISTNEKRVAAGSTFHVKFSDYQAYNYLAALNLLSFLYSSGQLLLLTQARSNRILSSPIKWGVSVYLCDQMLAFLMVSSSSSAATASELSRHGLHNIWPPACSTWKLSLFCTKADVAVAMSFISFLFMLLSSFSSAYNLSNLLAE